MIKVKAFMIFDILVRFQLFFPALTNEKIIIDLFPHNKISVIAKVIL
ncbi:MAG: hypothetical protein M0R05_04455 [Bacilli bacterium]|nr:hypothetical protein [Bacilli bacterium]MDD4077094.1 hypothetical protein [Bacilli bacterium]MDD4388457.1 hypothetical protein [Bacilli bacterium]